VAELVAVVALWDYLRMDVRASQGVYANVAQRYARTEPAVWEADVADETLRDAVVAWWNATYGDRSPFAEELVRVEYIVGYQRDVALQVHERRQRVALPSFPPVWRLTEEHPVRCTALGIGRPDAHIAAALGLLPQLQEALSRSDAPQLLTTKLAAAAASSGSLPCLTLLKELACPWDAATCLSAAARGHLGCLQYAHEGGCPWNADTCSRAAGGGHLDCLRYALANGCPRSEWIAYEAARGKHLACLRYAHEQGCALGHSLCLFAAKGGSVECLRYAREQGCPWNARTCWEAAFRNSLPCLRYAHENGCPWDAGTCTAAAYGRMECLRYAHEQGCPWDKEACVAAASTCWVPGGLQALQYLHDNGCPWDDETCLAAAKHGRLDRLRYAWEHGAPRSPLLCTAAQPGNYTARCFAFIHQQGCPSPDCPHPRP
jgi:hypothetical protein